MAGPATPGNQCLIRASIAPDCDSQSRIVWRSPIQYNIADLSRDESLVASGSFPTDDISVVDVATGSVQYRFRNPPSDFSALQFSPDGSLLAFTCLDGIVRIRRTTDGTLWKSFPTDADGIQLFSVFSPDGTRLATITEQGVIKIRDIASGSGGTAYSGASTYR